jgi:prepilin-type N-terminal cleavage/methylation domain-containing protein
MKKSGFTLIEIMVVVGIVGFLAALGTLAITKAITNGRIKGATTELEILSAATLQLAWDTGYWPNKTKRTAGGSVEIWDISPVSCGLEGTDGSYGKWKGPYYEGAVQDPWGNNYFFDPDYRIDGVDRVVVGSFGPNGRGPNTYDSDNIYILLDD